MTIWLPYTQMKNHLEQLDVKKARGSKIYLKDGRTLIDGISSWWSVCHGYSHPHLVKAIQKQAKKLSHIMLAGFKNDQTYTLGERLCQFSKMDKVFFSDSGSTAIEVAMKMAWQYFINIKQPNKTKFISFKNSYHGDTTGAMSLADLGSGMHKKFKKLLLKHYNLELPKTQNDLEKFEQFLIKKQDELAAIFIEPMVQCAGGMKFVDPKITKKIHSLAKQHNILFIADECAVGFYRTGKKFGFDHAKIKPDILCLGKALTGGMVTMAATLTNNKIYNSFLSDSLDNALMHGPTFMGNPLAAAAANASLDIFATANYEDKIKDDEKFLKEQLQELKSNPNVIDVRVVGLIAVVEIKGDFNVMLTLRQESIKYGVFLRPFANCIYLMPPLNITKKDLEKITTAIKNIL
ncbi:MAG: adenosylmethionine--8-amino-7-oxononanoate transaminase [Rickettsiales bacterium]|nr:adenosylmethionine--8-amino-7-oxononanoate transaminase [Rickettsiales bacterium]